MLNNKRAIIEWVIAVVLVVIVIFQSPFINSYHFTPLGAHERSERTYNFGPTEVVEQIDIGDARIYLGQYKNWFAANTVRKVGLFWVPGSNVGGYEIKENEDISYHWSSSSQNNGKYLSLFYGKVTNRDISHVMLRQADEEITYQLKEDGLFIFYWYEEDHRTDWVLLQGLNSEGEVLYEYNFQ